MNQPVEEVEKVREDLSAEIESIKGLIDNEVS